MKLLLRDEWSTLIATPDDGTGPSWVFTSEVFIENDHPVIPGNVLAFVYSFGSLRHFQLDEVEITSPGHAKVHTIKGTAIEIRELRESDAFAFRPGAVWPIPVITNFLEGGLVPEDLKALIDDNAYVVTLMLASEAGLFLRFSGAWQALPVIDPSETDPIDGLNVIDVTNDALAVFDLFDLQGDQPNVGLLPLAPGEDIGQFATALQDEANQAQRTTDQAAEETVVAAGMVPIHSAGDLDQAIVYAEADESMRWYVERRARALGLEDHIPWSNDA